jgi:hypothetical protein
MMLALLAVHLSPSLPPNRFRLSLAIPNLTNLNLLLDPDADNPFCYCLSVVGVYCILPPETYCYLPSSHDLADPLLPFGILSLYLISTSLFSILYSNIADPLITEIN